MSADETTRQEPPEEPPATAPQEPVPQDGTTAAEPVSQAQPAAPAEASAPEVSAPAAPLTARKPRRPGRIAAVAGSALLAVAVLAGVGVTAVTVRDADRDAGAPTWKFPKPTAESRSEAKAKKAGSGKGLGDLLVPYGTDSWVQGPDLAEFGSDEEFDGPQAVALRKKSLSGLPRTQRKRLERQIDRQRVTGMAVRSYFSAEADGYGADGGISSVRIVLSRMKDKGAVRDSARYQNELFGAVDVFRKGPKIKGHPHAKCFLTPKGTAKELDGMICSAYVGDVLIALTADGAKPLDTDAVATLLRTQLNRIDEQGVAV